MQDPASPFNRLKAAALFGGGPTAVADTTASGAASTDDPATQDRSTTVRVRVRNEFPPRDHPAPIPHGWFAAVRTTTLGPRHLISFRAVGQELIAYRDDSGMAHVLSAHCPHFGAHLGGGWISGERVTCPYHGWEFDGTGTCRTIPFHEGHIPGRARVDSFPVLEQDGFVWFWFHSAGRPPAYSLPPVPETASSEWTEAFPFDKDVVAALQEMAENNVDYAHFNFVHRANKMPLLSSVFTTDGPSARVVERLGDGLEFIRDVCGPGSAVLRVPGLMTVLAATTPIDRGACRLLWNFHFPESMRSAAQELVGLVVGDLGLEADIPIWADKVFPERPVLVRTDAPIVEFRRWYAQFYDDAAPQTALTASEEN